MSNHLQLKILYQMEPKRQGSRIGGYSKSMFWSTNNCQNTATEFLKANLKPKSVLKGRHFRTLEKIEKNVTHMFNPNRLLPRQRTTIPPMFSYSRKIDTEWKFDFLAKK